LFTKLYKFDGQQTRLLSARNFQQIGGRAGRRGFDDLGTVVCQAPEHVIENKIIDGKVQKGKKKAVRKKPPPDFVLYNEATFEKLATSQPEELRSSFNVTHGTLTNVLGRELTHGAPHGGYRRLVTLIGRSHESDILRSRHRKRAAQLFRALRAAGVIERVVPEWTRRPYVRLAEGLQVDFSLHNTLSLFLLDTLGLLDPKQESYALDALTVVEAILENPKAILFRQLDKAKGDLVADLKAQGIPYEERMERLEDVTYPKPNADFLYQAFDVFREAHPWSREDNVRPKSIARDMFERYASFNEYDRDYGLQRVEGILLRYVTETYKALVQTVPEEYKSDDLFEVITFFRTMLEQVDSSLVREWEAMLHPEELLSLTPEERAKRRDITRDKKSFYARIRAEMHRLVKALSARDWEDATLSVRPPEDSADEWLEDRFATALKPFLEEHGQVIFDHRARMTDLTLIEADGERQWRVRHTLLDPQEDNMWFVEARVDLRDPGSDEGPLLRLVDIGS
jgi:hypothetical protein